VGKTCERSKKILEAKTLKGEVGTVGNIAFCARREGGYRPKKKSRGKDRGWSVELKTGTKSVGASGKDTGPARTPSV